MDQFEVNMVMRRFLDEDEESVVTTIDNDENTIVLEDPCFSCHHMFNLVCEEQMSCDTRTIDKYTLNMEDEEYGDGDGSYQCVVFKLTNNETKEYVFIRVEGERSSWDDPYWEKDFYIVEPYEVTVRKWREPNDN